MYILKSTVNEIIRVIGTHPVESGGIIGSINNTICAFAFDSNYTSGYEYKPNVQYLNEVIRKWNSKGIMFCGIVHSHLFGFNYPSESDRIFAQFLCKVNHNLTQAYFPIITIDSNNIAQIDFYQFVLEKKDFIKLELCQNKKQSKSFFLRQI